MPEGGRGGDKFFAEDGIEGPRGDRSMTLRHVARVTPGVEATRFQASVMAEPIGRIKVCVKGFPKDAPLEWPHLQK